jgi:hypothetical protein
MNFFKIFLNPYLFFELFPFTEIFNSEIADERDPPDRRAWLTCTAPTPRLKATVGTARRTSRQPASLAPPASRQPASPASSTPRQRLTVPAHLLTAPHLACTAAALTGCVRAPLSEDATPRCPSASEPSPLPGRLRRREHDHSERRPSSPLAVLHPWSVDLTLPSLLAVVGPPPATVAPPRRRDAAAEPDLFSSPSMRSSGELAFRPPCPAGSLTLVGARPPPFASSPPLWRRCRPRRGARAGAVTAPACTAPRRRGPRWPRPAQRAQAVPAWPWAVRPHGRGPRMRCARGPSRRRGRGPSATVHLGRARIRPSCTRLNFINF